MLYPNAQFLRKCTLAALVFTTLTVSSAAAQGDAQNSEETIKTAITEGYVTPEQTGIENPGATQPNKRNLYRSPEIWVADISTHLFDDFDQDGYFASFTLSMDIDVDWDWADVFAEIYLQRSGTEPRLLHITQVFSIFENAFSDRYQVDVELLDNIPSGYYDLLVDIVNASTGQVVDTVSNSTHFNLENLPLESSDYQYAGPNFQPAVDHEFDYYEPENEIGYQTNYDVQFSAGSGYQNGVALDYGFSVQSVGHGGATGWLGILGLGLAAAARLRRRTK